MVLPGQQGAKVKALELRVILQPFWNCDDSRPL
jgi:hypothetical protein